MPPRARGLFSNVAIAHLEIRREKKEKNGPRSLKEEDGAKEKRRERGAQHSRSMSGRAAMTITGCGREKGKVSGVGV